MSYSPYTPQRTLMSADGERFVFLNRVYWFGLQFDKGDSSYWVSGYLSANDKHSLPLAQYWDRKEALGCLCGLQAAIARGEMDSFVWVAPVVRPVSDNPLYSEGEDG